MRRSRSIGSGNDSSATNRAVSKRQRVMMDQFETMSLNHNNNSSRTIMDPLNVANAHGDESSWTVTETSMSHDDVMSSTEMLTAEQAAQRNIVYQLALGKAPKDIHNKANDIVDQKLEDMIRTSRLQQVVSHQPSSCQRARDDFHVQTPYSHASVAMRPDTISASTRQRSNSLPQEWNGTTGGDNCSMDVDMML